MVPFMNSRTGADVVSALSLASRSSAADAGGGGGCGADGGGSGGGGGEVSMDALGERRGVGALEPVHQASLGVEGEERHRVDVEAADELVHLLGLDAEEPSRGVRAANVESS